MARALSSWHSVDSSFPQRVALGDGTPRLADASFLGKLSHRELARSLILFQQIDHPEQGRMGCSGVLVVVVYNPCALWPGLGPRKRLSGLLRLSCKAFVGYIRTQCRKQCEQLPLASGEDFQKLQLALYGSFKSESSDEQWEVHYVGLLTIKRIQHHLHQNLWVR
jgi:hypothetical protein